MEKAAALEEWAQEVQACRETVDQLTKQLQEQHAESMQVLELAAAPSVSVCVCVSMPHGNPMVGKE